MALKESNKNRVKVPVTYTEKQTCSIVSNLVFGFILAAMGVFVLLNTFIFLNL